MAQAVVQSKVGNPVSNFDSTTLSFTSTPAVGNMVVVCITGWRTAGSGGFEVPAGSVTDNQGNLYRIAVVGDKSATTKRAAIFYSFNVNSSGTFTVTLDPTGTGNYASWSISEVSNCSRSDPLDKTAQQQSSGTTLSSNTTSATAQNNEIVFSCLASSVTEASITVGVVSPIFNQIYEQLSDTYIPGEADYRVVSSSGTQACTWTVPTTCTYSACIATFKEITTTTFPTLGVLDNFNRADSGSLGANWTDGLNGYSIVSNTAAPENAAWNISSWNAVSSADFGCYVTMSTLATGDKGGVYGRWNGTNGTGYGVTAHVISGDNEFNIYRTDAFTDTNLGQINAFFKSGDKIGMSMVGSILSVYYCPSGGSWELAGTYTDATYGSAGLIEMVAYGTTIRLDDFGGGAISTTSIKDLIGCGMIPFNR